MASNLYFTLVFLFISGISIAQNNIKTFIYQLDYVRDTLKMNEVNSENMILYMDENNSYFKSYNSYLKDSIFLDMEEKNTFSFNFTGIPRSHFNYIIVKNNSEDEIEFYDIVFNDKYKYIENTSFDWKIKSDTLTINSLLCQKATTSFGGRDYIAWFTQEIPISDGPYKFRGLPGLIVKIYDTQNHYIFTLTDILNYNLNKKYVLLENLNWQKVSKSKFNKAREIAYKNPVKQIQNLGINIDELSNKKLKDKMRKYSNPIEINE